MAKKKASRIVHEEKKVNSNTFAVRRSYEENLGIVRCERCCIEAEFEGKVAMFLDEDGEIVAAIRDWEEIRKLDEDSLKSAIDKINENFNDKLEKIKKTAKPGEFPEEWGKVNGKDF